MNMRLCHIQILFKIFFGTFLVLWIVLESTYHKRRITNLYSFSRHVVLTEKRIRICYGALIVITGILFALGYLIFPFFYLNPFQKTCMILLTLVYIVFFVDLFYMYTCPSQFKAYHNLLFMIILILIGITTLVFHIFSPFPRTRYSRVSLITMILLTCVVFIIFYARWVVMYRNKPLHISDEDRFEREYFCWGVCECVLLLYILCLFPVFCNHCEVGTR